MKQNSLNKKRRAYKAQELYNVEMVKEVYGIWEQHKEEVNEVWNRIDEEGRRNLFQAFIKELEQEWSTEFLEITIEKFVRTTLEKVMINICRAYIAGYIVGKDWISFEHLPDFYLYLGDMTASHIKSVWKRAKSRGTTFANAFAMVGVKGHSAALATRN
jgi:hypothetical protein